MVNSIRNISSFKRSFSSFFLHTDMGLLLFGSFKDTFSTELGSQHQMERRDYIERVIVNDVEGSDFYFESAGKP